MAAGDVAYGAKQKPNGGDNKRERRRQNRRQ
jgi:hypothetical protein